MNLKSKYQQALKSSLAYGGGLLLGNTLSVLIFQLVSPEWFLLSEKQGLRLIQGILLAFIITGTGGFLGGFIGGYTLPAIGIGKDRWGYAWRSGFTFGIGYGLLVFPIILIIALLSFYDISSTPAYVFTLIYGVVGVIFGVIMGLSLGVWTIGRRFPQITRYSALGFGCGGFVLGYTLWVFIFAVNKGQLENGPWWILMLGSFLFASSGGAALGHVYHRLATETTEPIVPFRGLSFSGKLRRWAIVGTIVFILLLFTRPLIAAVGDLLTPVDATLSPVLDLPTTGTHWLPATTIAAATQPSQSVIASGANGRLALAWIEDEQLLLQLGQWSAETKQSEWQTTITVPTTSAPNEPQLTFDDDGHVHIVWIGSDNVQYNYCRQDECSAPSSISLPDTCDQQVDAQNHQVAITAKDDQILVIWENSGQLPYVLWPIDSQPPATATGCVPVANNATTPRLAFDSFDLIYTADNSITTARFEQKWSTPNEMGSGKLPEIFTNGSGVVHAAWCDLEANLLYASGDKVEIISEASCKTRPTLGSREEPVIALADGPGLYGGQV